MFADQYQTPLVIGPFDEKLGERDTYSRQGAEEAYSARMTDIALDLLAGRDLQRLSLGEWDLWVAEFYRRELVAYDTPRQ